MPVRDPTITITAEQLELIAMVASGKSHREIAELKFMHPNTVRYQLAQAMDRTGAVSTMDLAICCARAGLIYRNGQGYKPVQADRVIG